MLKKFTGLACLLALPAAMYAQTITGSISGHVVDQQGGVVVNALVTATEAARQTVTTQHTSANGDFSLTALQPGSYSITIEAPGFKKMTRSSINLDANDKLALGDLALQVGAVTESSKCRYNSNSADGKRGTLRDHHRQADRKHRSQRPQSAGHGEAGSRRVSSPPAPATRSAVPERAPIILR